MDEYIHQYRVEAESYKMMGKMLDVSFVQRRLDQYNLSDLYLYGGTYLAAQFCRSSETVSYTHLRAHET